MHYSEEDLILHYYGEHRRRVRIDQHLASCGVCASAYREIVDSLALVSDREPPDRSDDYGREVWLRIRHQLPEREAPWWVGWVWPDRLALAGGVVALALAAFAAGRFWSTVPPPPRAATGVVEAPAADAGERVRLAAVGDHLEQSERVLLDIVNAYGTAEDPADVSQQQLWAADLIDANRLYRDASAAAGDEAVALLLDELERSLLDIVHGPASLPPAELDRIRMQFDAAALLFRVRVLSDQVRERELAPITPRKTT